jgi:uncharacterized protein
MKVAIVGSGVSGLAVAHELRDRACVTLFEAGSHFGGHAHTVDVTLPGPHGPVTHGVDIGFLVFNERTYPNLIRLFAELGVARAKSDMSFSVQVPGAASHRGLEWAGTNLDAVFSQRRNLLRPSFWRMLRDLLRFNALATRIVQAGHDAALRQPLGRFLDQHDFSQPFRDWYLLPMLGCIWSCPTDQMLQFPVATMLQFCHNHGLLQVSDRPQWWTVAGGSRNYVERIVAGIPDRRLNTTVRRVRRDAHGVELLTPAGWERFDKVVLATHADQSLALLESPTLLERDTLAAIRYQPNRGVLHTDASMLPAVRARASWNYERAQGDLASARVCLHYLLNRLQPLPWERPVILSLNPVRPIDPQQVIGEYSYLHPVFDRAAVKAQASVGLLQGRRHTYFCGAWTGYGFHEDGLASGQAVARQLRIEAVASQPEESLAA